MEPWTPSFDNQKSQSLDKPSLATGLIPIEPKKTGKLTFDLDFNDTDLDDLLQDVSSKDVKSRTFFIPRFF